MNSLLNGLVKYAGDDWVPENFVDADFREVPEKSRMKDYKEFQRKKKRNNFWQEEIKRDRMRQGIPTDFKDAKYKHVRDNTYNEADFKGAENLLDAGVKALPPGQTGKKGLLAGLGRKQKIGLGVAGLAAATGAGLYAHNRYKKKKQRESEQEKVASIREILGGY